MKMTLPGLLSTTGIRGPGRAIVSDTARVALGASRINLTELEHRNIKHLILAYV